jgi:hypothetical protein
MSAMERDFRLDSLRGLVLILMLLFHLGPPLDYFFPNLVSISIAGGFVFLSGLVGGMVYGKIGLNRGRPALRRKAFRRALNIYLYHMIAFILIMLLLLFSRYYSYYYGSWNPTSIAAPGMALVFGALFLYQPRFFDILPMYCLFFLITPFIISCFIKKRGLWILSGSFLIWAPATYHSWDRLQSILSQYLPCYLSSFNPFAWQFIFIGGLFFGFQRLTKEEPLIPINTSLLVISLGIIIGISHLDFREIPLTIMGLDLLNLTKKASFGPLALINFIAEVYMFTYIGIRLPYLLKWSFLAFLGRHSLQVFFFHLLLLYTILPLYHLVIPFGRLAIIAANIIFIGSLSFPAWIHLKFRKG